MTMEDQLRAAGRAVRDQVRDLPELDLTRSTSARLGARSRARRLWRAGWLIPLAAAAAVIVVAATLVSVRTLSGTAPHGAGQSGAATSGATANPDQVPAYYVALSFGASPQGTSVRNAFLADASTGKQLATFKPPSNAIFADIAASSDDKTFVLDAVAGPGLGPSGRLLGSFKTTQIWYLLRLTPGTAQHARLTRIPIASSFTDTSVSGLAVSPDGRTLAILFQADAGDAPHKTPPGPLTLRTYSLATGQMLRTWTDPTPSSSATGSGDLSWLDDGDTLAFAYPILAAHQTLRTLDTTRPGSNLIADSRTVFPVPTGTACVSPLLTSDGQSVICGTSAPNGCAKAQPELVAYSVATGKLERVLYQHQGNCSFGSAQVDWAESATLAIGFIEILKPVNPPPPVTNMVGVVTPGRFTLLPVTLKGEAYGLGAIAF